MTFVKHESGSHISNLNASQFPMPTKIKYRLFIDCNGDWIPVDFSNTFPWLLNLYVSMDSAIMTYSCSNHNLFFMTLNVMFHPVIVLHVLVPFFRLFAHLSYPFHRTQFKIFRRNLSLISDLG